MIYSVAGILGTILQCVPPSDLWKPPSINPPMCIHFGALVITVGVVFLFDVGRWYFIACLLNTPRSPIFMTSKESQSVFRAVASYTGKVNLERGACLLLLLSSVRFPVTRPVSEISTYQGEGVSVAFL